mmetsp:Transcript_117656/g.340143  ORF Transcript_117656/g.340143 Transcript_117656/m.340143 type:complete len:204 (+) Transcript_117656:590-1201(+)
MDKATATGPVDIDVLRKVNSSRILQLRSWHQRRIDVMVGLQLLRLVIRVKSRVPKIVPNQCAGDQREAAQDEIRDRPPSPVDHRLPRALLPQPACVQARGEHGHHDEEQQPLRHCGGDQEPTHSVWQVPGEGDKHEAEGEFGQQRRLQGPSKVRGQMATRLRQLPKAMKVLLQDLILVPPEVTLLQYHREVSAAPARGLESDR